MKKMSIFIVLTALSVNTAFPAESYAASARGYFKHASQQAVKGKNKIQHLWFCFRNRSQCSAQEYAQAQRWIYGTSAAIVLALLLRAGIPMTMQTLNRYKNRYKAEQGQWIDPEAYESGGKPIKIQPSGQSSDL